MRKTALITLSALVGAGCLDPLVSDDVDPADVFGAAGAPVHHVEDIPALASNVAAFPGGTIQRLQGYADGQEVWYFNVPPPLSTTIVPLYAVIDGAGEPVDRPIIDVLPGSGGYSPLWRVLTVKTTAAYAGEIIRSLAAIDLGVQLGILEAPVATSRVVNCPVVRRDTAIELSLTATAAPTKAWFRNREVSWFEFSDVLEVPVDTAAVGISPVYIFQRSDEAFPIYEFATGIDEDGDLKFHSSNNVFGALEPTDPDYTPIWFVSIVRTTPDYASIDTPGAQVGLTHGDDVRTSTSVVSVTDQRGRLVNCPLQRQEGAL